VAILLLFVPIIAAMASDTLLGSFDLIVGMALGWLLSVPIGFIGLGGPSIGRGVGWLLAGITIVDALAVATVSLPLAVLFACLAPVLRFWQRWVAAT
jgi:hypothetical protein